MISIEEFCDLSGACDVGRDWALANCSDMSDVWAKLKRDWLLWVATQQGVLTDRELRLFAVFCARQVKHLLTDQRSIDAIDTAERYALGQATAEELAAARIAASAAARDAGDDTYRAANAAAKAKVAAADAAAAAHSRRAVTAASAAAAAADAAKAAASAWAVTAASAAAAQSDWLRENTRPNFEVTE